MSYKPRGFNSVSPYLIVAQPEDTLDFLKAVFGCEPFETHRNSDGAIRHTQVRIDDSVVMIGGAAGGPESHVHIYIDDVDEAFAAAKAAGGRVVQELAVQDDGERRGGIKDAGGTTWWLARYSDSDVNPAR